MKKTITLLLLALIATTASARHHRADTLNNRLFDAKVRELVYRLAITDEQKTKFVPIYRRYCEEMITAWGDHERPERATTTQQAAENTKKHLERQQRAQAVRIKYVDEFATVLNPDQLSRFFRVESDIQKKLKARRDKPRHNRDGNRPHHGKSRHNGSKTEQQQRNPSAK